MLEVCGIEKSFGKGAGSVRVLDGVSLFADRGEKVGLAGKSGIGKTTLARIITGLERPDAGNVLLDGIPLYGCKFSYDRKRGVKIQTVPQHPFASLDPSQKVGAGVSEALRVHMRVGVKESRDAAVRLLERVWLGSEIYDRYPSQISGGQAQRVAVAKALAVSPQVLIADEATAMLDAYQQAQVIALLNDLAERDGLSVLLISHDGKLTENFADRLYVLEGGKLREASLRNKWNGAESAFGGTTSADGEESI